jgi:hypothetical protein
MPIRSSKRIALGLSTLFAVVALAVGATHGLSAQRQVEAVSVDGVYKLRLDLHKSEAAARDAAIASAVRNLEPEVGKYWQGVLEMMALPQGRVSIVTANGEIAIARGNRPALASAANGTSRAVGESTQLTQKLESDGLVQRVTSTSLGREALQTPLQITRKYSLGEDQRTLTIETRIVGAVVTQAVVFNTTYQRI